MPSSRSRYRLRRFPSRKTAKKKKSRVVTSNFFYISCQSTLPWSYDRSGKLPKTYKSRGATSDSFYISCQSTLPWSYDRSGLRSEGYIRFRKIDTVWMCGPWGSELGVRPYIHLRAGYIVGAHTRKRVTLAWLRSRA